jgi:hypothetical protein
MSPNSNVVIQDELGDVLGGSIPDGTHRCITVAKVLKSKKPSNAVPMLDGETRTGVYLLINYVIADEDSEFHGADDIRDMFELFPGIGRDDIPKLTPKQRTDMRNQIKNRQNRFTDLGIDKEFINTIDEAMLSDIEVNVTVFTSTSKKTEREYLNIKNIELITAVNEGSYLSV